MKWGLSNMKIGDVKLFEYNDFTKSDILQRLNIRTIAAAKRDGFKFKKRNALEGVYCERVA